jgi:phosphoethanolamine N-methyltransferase
MYKPENIALYEAIYGTHLISLGGTEGIELLFSGINVQNMKAVDIGFGLGGVAYYLAKQYQMQIMGVEIHPWMVEHATKQAPETVSHLLHFSLYDENGQIPVEPQSIDIVYSKGVLNHIQSKAPLFETIHSALKPHGLFVASDWLFTNSNAAESSPFPLARETKNSYQQLLKQCGFCEIEFRDDSLPYLEFVHALLKNIHEKQSYIEENFGKQLFIDVKNQHTDLIKEITNKQKFATRIMARKS